MPDVQFADPGQDRDRCDAVVTIDLATLAIGDVVTLPCAMGMRFGAPCRLMVEPPEEPRGWFRVTSTDYDKETGILTAEILEISDDIADLEETEFERFNVFVWDFGGALTVRQAFSNDTPYTMQVGVIEFPNVQAGKQFPVGASVDLLATRRRRLAALARVIYYTDETLRVKIEKASDITGNSPNEVIPTAGYDGPGSVEIVNPGSGYENGDTITLANGTVLTNTSHTDPYDTVTEVEITTKGDWTSLPSNPVSQVSTSGVGTGATFNVTTAIQQTECLIELIDRAPPGIPVAGLSGLGVELVTTDKVANPATLPASNGFGCAMSPDGLTLAVAHPTTPFITIYRRTAVGADDWTKIANPATLPTGDGYGCAISPDGLTLAVVHDVTPFVTIYRRTSVGADDWTKIANPATLPTGNGIGCAISPDGLTLAVAHTVTPFVTIYRRTSAAADDWTKVANPATLPTGAGGGCAISPDGLTLAVAHNVTPFVTIYRRTSVGADDWTKIANPATLPTGEGFGCAISPDGLTLAVVHTSSPRVTIYRRTSAAADDWTKVANPVTLPTGNGLGCAMSPDGLILTVAHVTTPFITIYRRTAVGADDWTKVANPATLPTEQGNGCAISPDGLTLAVAHNVTPFVTIYRNPDAGTLIYVNRGTVRSYDDSTDIVVEEAGVFRIHQLYEDGGLMVRAALAGTGTSAGTALTGISTAFLAAFGSGSAQAFLADYDDQITGILRDKSIVTAGLKSSGVASASSDTAAVTISALLASASALKRGGYSMEAGTIYLGFGVAFNDTDGSTTRFITALTGSGVPDLPAGHTKYRIVVILKLVDGEVAEVLQPLVGQSVPDANEINQDNTNGLGATVQAALDTLAARSSPQVIDSDTFATASTVDCFFPAGYTSFRKLVYELDFTVSIDAAELFARTSTAAAFESGVADYAWFHETRPVTTGAAVLTPDASDSEIELCLNVGNVAGEGGTLTITIRNPTNTTRRQGIEFEGTNYLAAANGPVQTVQGLGERRAGQDTDGIQFLPSTGTISGSWTLTGYL